MRIFLFHFIKCSPWWGFIRNVQSSSTIIVTISTLALSSCCDSSFVEVKRKEYVIQVTSLTPDGAHLSEKVSDVSVEGPLDFTSKSNQPKIGQEIVEGALKSSLIIFPIHVGRANVSKLIITINSYSEVVVDLSSVEKIEFTPEKELEKSYGTSAWGCSSSRYQGFSSVSSASTWSLIPLLKSSLCKVDNLFIPSAHAYGCSYPCQITYETSWDSINVQWVK